MTWKNNKWRLPNGETINRHKFQENAFGGEWYEYDICPKINNSYKWHITIPDMDKKYLYTCPHLSIVCKKNVNVHIKFRAKLSIKQNLSITWKVPRELSINNIKKNDQAVIEKFIYNLLYHIGIEMWFKGKDWP